MSITNKLLISVQLCCRHGGSTLSVVLPLHWSFFFFFIFHKYQALFCPGLMHTLFIPVYLTPSDYPPPLFPLPKHFKLFLHILGKAWFLSWKSLMTSTRSINPVPFNLYYSQRHVILKKKKKRRRCWYHCYCWKEPETSIHYISNVRIFFYLSCFLYRPIIIMYSPVKRSFKSYNRHKIHISTVADMES